MKTNLTLAGIFSYENRGCEAIMRGTVGVIEKVVSETPSFIAIFDQENKYKKTSTWDKNIKYIPTSMNPPRKYLLSVDWWKRKITSFINPEKARFYQFRKLKKYFRKSSAVLMVGGDNYSFDYGYPDLWFRLNQLALETQVSTVLWGASVGPFSSDPQYEKWAAIQLKKVQRIYARESVTVDYLASLGITENVIRMVDPAFFMQPEKANLTDQIENLVNEGAIGLNLSPLLARFREDKSLDSWVLESKAIIQDILKKFSLPIILIPHVTSQIPNIKNDDGVFMNNVWSLLGEKEKSRVALVGDDLNAAQMKWIIRQTRCFIGARTHTTIASLSSEIPTISLIYSQKGKGINKDIFDNEHWLIQADKINSSILTNRLSDLLSNHEEVRNTIKSKIPYFESLAELAVLDLMKIVQ